MRSYSFYWIKIIVMINNWWFILHPFIKHVHCRYERDFEVPILSLSDLLASFTIAFLISAQ